MLMRDYTYQIYRSLYSCLEVTDTSAEPTATSHTEENETNTENKKDEIVEPMNTDITTNENEDVDVPGLDLNAEENEKKRKRAPSQVSKKQTMQFSFDMKSLLFV